MTRHGLLALLAFGYACGVMSVYAQPDAHISGLEIRLERPAEWDEAIEEYGDGGPAGRVLTKRGGVGSLQVSLLRLGAEKLATRGRNLAQDAQGLGEAAGMGKPEKTGQGRTAFGRFGKAIFRGPGGKGELIWLLSDDQHVLLCTYGYDSGPDIKELDQVEQIVASIRLVSNRSSRP